jgi:hypothetical protein
MSSGPADPGPRRPDFFIVGAFKSGTTALYEYLRQHPQVFMPFHKEPLFFGDDLNRRYGRMTQQQYLGLFRDAQAGQRVGEASTWYLYSASAAHEIAAFSPDAQIIVMLRNPVDVMYAQHSQLLFNSSEDLTDFRAALDAEPARRRGERIPHGPLRPENLYYRESVRFAEQLERYLDTFGPERVHVIVFDDFVADTAATYRATLDFLGVDGSFAPRFDVFNESKRVRSPVLQRLIYRPPGPLAGAASALRRHPAMHRLRARVVAVNSRPQQRRQMDAVLREQLLTEFRPEVERLAALIGRDLSMWYEVAARPGRT